ncbi:hypothetical protein H5410_002149 [Solanum commersonii]|uniref:Uncharacterized protein n=1 Tax=Solanum commersonii TaxID=4109 RepID=A0A9J6B163_SOLCO|nr:hypothetical protein H5410_002149 [Solanum commersonii]
MNHVRTTHPLFFEQNNILYLHVYALNTFLMKIYHQLNLRLHNMRRSYSCGIHESCTNYLFIIVRVKYHPTFGRMHPIVFDRKSTINSSYNSTTCEFTKCYFTFPVYASGIFYTGKFRINSTCELAKCHPTFSCICIQYFFIGKSTIKSNLTPQCASSQRYDGMVIWSISSSNHNH